MDKLKDKLSIYYDDIYRMEIPIYNKYHHKDKSVSVADVYFAMITAAEAVDEGSFFVKGLEDIFNGYIKVHNEKDSIEQKLSLNNAFLKIIKNIENRSMFHKCIHLTFDEIYNFSQDKEFAEFILKFPENKRMLF